MSDLIEASSKLEAVTRLSALVDAPPETLGPGSKERKSLLVNLANALHLDVDTTRDKPALASQIAKRLDMVWTADCWSSGHTITLAGLNRLLAGTHREVARRSQGMNEQPPPARSKLEAVTRISSLTEGPPQTLGPGSKERKSVLIDLAAAMRLDVDTRASKPFLGEAIVRALGGTWEESCWSAGQTVTLEGLNRILTLAEAELSRRGRTVGPQSFTSPEDEAQALLAILQTAVPARMDGRVCVTEMLEAEARNWAQDEWRGWYFEFFGLPSLINAFGGGPTAVANTTFDYSLGEIWDLKCHGDDSHSAILNSRASMDACLLTRGIGLLVLTGTTEVDTGEFRQWQRDLRVANGKSPKPRIRPATSVRRSKAAFVPTRLDAYFITGREMLTELIDHKVMTVMTQGRQVDGAERGEKYVLNTKRAVTTTAHLAHVDLRDSESVLA